MDFDALICGLMISCVSAHSRKMVQVDDSFDGREVALGAGGMLEVRLSEDPSTGHRWAQTEASRSGWSAILRQVDDTFDSSGTVPGKSGTRIFRFEAIGAGGRESSPRREPSIMEKTRAPGRRFQLSTSECNLPAKLSGSSRNRPPTPCL